MNLNNLTEKYSLPLEIDYKACQLLLLISKDRRWILFDENEASNLGEVQYQVFINKIWKVKYDCIPPCDLEEYVPEATAASAIKLGNTLLSEEDCEYPALAFEK